MSDSGWVAILVAVTQLVIIVYLLVALGRAHLEIEKLKFQIQKTYLHEIGRARKERL